MTTRKVTIERPRETVWDALAQFADIDLWAGSVDHSTLLTDLTTGIGTARRIQKGRTVVIETVTAWDNPRTLEYDIQGLPDALGPVWNRWDLTARGDNCEVSLTATVGADARGPARLAGRAIGLVLSRVNARMLEDLRHRLETQGDQR